MLSHIFQRGDRSFFNATLKLTDDQFCDMVISSLQNPIINGIKMPGFPEETIQFGFVGVTKEQALVETDRFFKPKTTNDGGSGYDD